jgi:histidinol-phosphate aminotransferase
MGYFRDNIEAMEGYVPGYQPTEPGFIKLNTNENPYPASARVVAALRISPGDILRRYPEPQADAFRHAAASVYGVAPGRVICGNGSDDLLTIAMRSFCGEGDRVAFPWPTYSLYPKLAEIQGAVAVAIDFPEDYSLPDGLARADAALTLLANPNAPSGTMVPPDQVAALAESVSGVLLVDEAYVAFAETNCLDLVEQYDNVVVTRSLSKSHSLAGLRFGFGFAQEPLIEGMMKVKDSYNVGALAIAGAVAAIEDRGWLEQNVKSVRATRAHAIEQLQQMGFFCWPSESNFVLARVPAGRDAKRVFEQLFERKILVRYFDAPRTDDCLRITIGNDEEIHALIRALRDILAEPEGVQ